MAFWLLNRVLRVLEEIETSDLNDTNINLSYININIPIDLYFKLYLNGNITINKYYLKL